MPASWEDLFGARPGRARFRRLFHRPTNVGPDERLYLVVERVAGAATVKLDGLHLGSIAVAGGDGEFEVTDLVRPNSELSIELAHNPALAEAGSDRVWETVAIEVRSGSG
ncbi:MAG: hypothetical protein WED34_04070 [Planctomycetales bacterium]